MKIRTVFALTAIVLLAVSCTPKQAKVAEATPAATAAAPSDIKDVATWTATYDSVLSQYKEIAAKVNGGDGTAMNKANELVKTASELDAVAETLKSSLSGQELADFTAKAKEYKGNFAIAATSN